MTSWKQTLLMALSLALGCMVTMAMGKPKSGMQQLGRSGNFQSLQSSGSGSSMSQKITRYNSNMNVLGTNGNQSSGGQTTTKYRPQTPVLQNFATSGSGTTGQKITKFKPNLNVLQPLGTTGTPTTGGQKPPKFNSQIQKIVGAGVLQTTPLTPVTPIGPAGPVGPLNPPGGGGKPPKWPVVGPLEPVLDPGNGGGKPPKPIGPIGPVVGPLEPVVDPGNGGGKPPKPIGPIGPVVGPLEPVLDPGNGNTPPTNPPTNPPTDPPTNPPTNPPTTPPTTPPVCPPHEKPHWTFPIVIPVGGGFGGGGGYYGGTTTIVQPVYTPVPQAVTAGTAVPSTGTDLELVEVRQLDRGDMSKNLGPAFRLTLRNTSGAKVTQSFNVALMGSIGRVATPDSAVTTVRLEGLPAGQAHAVDVRLPAKSYTMGVNADGQQVPFTWLTAVLDTDGEVPQSSRDNDFAIMNRSEIVMVAQQ
jgi:hypothetical protein